MLQSAKKLPDGTTLSADICIVGAGPAGITLAISLMAHGKNVLLIEAGGPRGEAGAQAFYKGYTDNPALHQAPETDRTRGLGGTSAMWGGRCMPYDPQDFDRRDHIENSGWPFAIDTLEPYYRAAQTAAEAGNWAYTAAEAGLPGDMIERAETDVLRLDTLERWSPPTHFGKKYRDDLRASMHVTVLTGAVAVGLAEDNGQVTEIQLRTVKGNKNLRVKAGTVVLAGGGLEVPRLLMHTATGAKPALGDHSGWLGRGYMSHVGGVIAKLHISAGRSVVFGYEQDTDNVYLRRRLTLSAAAQAAHRLPNMYALLDRPLLDDASHDSAVLSLTYLAKRLLQRQSRSEYADKSGNFANYKRHLKNLLFGAPEVLTVLPRFGRKRFLTGRRLPSLLLKSKGDHYYLYFHAEQSAVQDSRIALVPETDALGMRKLRVEVKLSEPDAEGIVRAHRLIGSELKKTGAGQLEFLGADPLALVKACKATLGHHVGATRMTDSPATGVVDKDCKVFGTNNLYIASAAVLPSSSQAHPTLTVLALALRLSDHLAKN